MTDYTIEQPTDDSGGKYTLEHPDEPEPTTSAAGIGGAATRGIAPYAAAAMAGAGVGGLMVPGFGAIPGALAGLGAAGLTDLVSTLSRPAHRALGTPEVPPLSSLTDPVLDKMGVRRPQTGTERTVEAGAAGVGGALGGVGLGRTVAETAAGPVMKGVGETMAGMPGKAAVSGGLAGTASQGTAEAGGAPVAQTVAGMVAGGLPFAGAGIRAGGAKLVESTPTEAALAAHKAGYVLTPAMVSEKPSKFAAALAGDAGKAKLQQFASQKNQQVTDALAAQDLGLKPDTVLNDKAFQDVRAGAGQVYQKVAQAVPTIRPSPEFLAAVDKVGGAHNEELEKLHPSMKENPDISTLKSELKKYDQVSTPVAMKVMSDLRFNANQNLKAIGDPQKHQLGLAQRDAAHAIEDEIERTVQHAPDYYGEKFHEALTAQGDAAKAVSEAGRKLTRARATLATQSDIYVAADAMRDERAALKALSTANDRYAATQKAVESWRSRLTDAHQQNASNQTLLNEFRAARQLYAKSFDIEAATNPSTHHVDARAIARAGNKGKPLSGNLRTIMDAANHFPKAVQNPAQFGGSEDWSALDYFGMASAAGHGNVPLAMGLMARPWVRGMVLKPGFQGAMMGETGKSAASAMDLIGGTE